MSLAHKNIQLLIAHKEEELKMLKEEWKQASYHPEDTDYRHLTLLYPIIAELEREVARFRELAANEHAEELYFLPYMRRLLNGECHSLEMHIEFGRDIYINFKGPLMILNRTKQKYAVTARLRHYDWLENFLHRGNFSQLTKLGWKREGKQAFKLKYFVRDEDDLMQFYGLIACTFMEPLSYLIQRAKKQYLVVIPSPGS